MDEDRPVVVNGNQCNGEQKERDTSHSAVGSDASQEGSTSPTMTTAQDVTARALDFLSNASNETLGACLVGFAAVTYLVLGRVGLLLIGIVGGVILHAAWENNTEDHIDGEAKATEIRRRREVGLDVVHRVLNWRDQKRKQEDGRQGSSTTQAEGGRTAQKKLDFSGFPSKTAEALTTLVDVIVRDYVKWWYSPLVPKDDSFPDASRQTLTAFFISISSHVGRKRPADTFLDLLTNSISIVIVFLSELSTALSSGTSDSPDEAVHQYLEANPDSNLASILDVDTQQKKLEGVAEEILQNFVDTRAYACDPARLFLKQMLAGVVLEMTIASCSKPEWLNGWIVYLLEDGEPELMNAIDAGIGGANGDVPPPNGHTKASTTDGSTGKRGHERRVSKAESAMEEAMQEAERLNQLIAEDDARKAVRQSESTDGGRPSTSITDEVATPTPEPPSQPFTSFDQIVPHAAPTALLSDANKPRPALARAQTDPLTLFEASIVIFDDAAPGEKAVNRSKPTIDYLLQIEPASASHAGWMIARKYVDFETLHEVLRRISKVSGVTGFTHKHEELPHWKGTTKPMLSEALERYLCDALGYRQLAESEGMKRFLEKDQGKNQAPQSGNTKGLSGLGWPNPAAFETMGKGMLDVLASAPKGAAGGGKAILGGVSGALGGIGSIGPKRSSTAIETGAGRNSYSVSVSGSDAMLDKGYTSSPRRDGRASQDSFRTGAAHGDQSPHMPSLDRRRSHTVAEEPELSASATSSVIGPASVDLDQPPTLLDTLPPPPSDIPDDYGSSMTTPASSTLLNGSSTIRSSVSSLQPPPSELLAHTSTPGKKAPSSPLTERETRVAVELLFALITSLYTLSSAWTIRRTLLTAAKTYLLRPGNPNLEAIRVLLQESVIDANTSDGGIAAHVKRVIHTAFPTEQELKAWPEPLTPVEKEELRQKARRLLVARGMPQALRGVMGGAASGEALGRVFDVLQSGDGKVLRGVVGGVVVQGVRAIVQ